MVGPTSSTGAESEDGRFRSPMPSCAGEAFMVTLKSVAPANKRQAAAKIFGLASAFDMMVSLIGSFSLTTCCWLLMERHRPMGSEELSGQPQAQGPKE